MTSSSIYLVTGGAGFIGSHVVERLLAQGHRVRVLDNFSTGSRGNLVFAMGDKRLEIVRGDLKSLATVERAVRGVTAVFHQAAMRSVPRSIADPLGANASNVTGTLHVLVAAARQKKRPRVVYASSSSVYGERPDLPKREEQPTAPISPYAASKVAGELYASVWSRLFGVETVGLRYFNVFGPRQDPKSEYAAVIPRFILWGRQGKPLQVHGDGTQSRDFTYIDNVVSANLLAAAAPAQAVSGKSYNVGCGSRTSLLEIIASLELLLGRPLTMKHQPGRVGDVPHTLADISAAKRDMGYEPLVDFAEGLRRTVDYFTGGNTMTMLRGLVLTLLALLLGAAPAAAQGALTVQVSTEPPGLDLTTNPSSAIAGVVFYNVQEGLVKVDRHGKLVPWLAERWYTTDSKNYTFFLRKGVHFHNGREMKAADVKFALDRAVNPETKHPYRVQYENIQDVIVKDDYTISVTLKRVEANFLWTVARQGSVIYPREAVETLKTQPVGTGPFTVSDWVRGDRIVLVKNKDYWQKGLPKLDKVTYRFIPDPNSALAALKSGDIDVSAFGLGPENVDELKKDGRFQVILGDTTNDVTLSMNNSKKPYSDKRVRLAITHAINKEEVLKGAMFGYGKILGSNVDPLNPYYVDVSKREPYDPAKAKKLLAEAGYPNGFEAIFKVAPQYYYTVRSAEIVVNQLAKVGIKAKIQQIEWGQWLAQVFCLKPCENPDYDMSIIGHAEAWDIGNFANPKYYFRWDSPEFQALFKESEVTVDDKKRRELYVKMQQMLADEAPAVWLYMHPRLVVTKKGVTGIWKDLPIPSLDLSEVGWQK